MQLRDRRWLESLLRSPCRAARLGSSAPAVGPTVSGMPALPNLPETERLPAHGPYSVDAQPRWFPTGVHVVELPEYERWRIDSGEDPRTVVETIDRMRKAGVEEVLWAAGYGGRQGRFRAAWDVRVAATESDAVEVVRGISGANSNGGHLPTELQGVGSDAAVVTARCTSSQPYSIRLHGAARPRLARLLGLPGQVRVDYTHHAYVALGVEAVGATVITSAVDRGTAVTAALKLTRTILRDFERASVR